MINKGELEYRRAEFAAAAMQGAMANPVFANCTAEVISAMCVEQAEALLRELYPAPSVEPAEA